MRLLLLVLFALGGLALVEPPVVRAGCYSYPSSYSSYPSYSYSTPRYYSVPVYKEVKVYKEYPVARYVDIYPVYGQLYFGPASAAAYATAVNAATQAKTATSTATRASSQLTTIQGDVKSVLGAVKDLAGIVSATQAKVSSLEARLGIVERQLKPSQPPPVPVPEPAKGAKPAGPGPDALRVTQTKCAACHQEGKPVKGKLTLLTAAGQRAPLTGDQVAAMTARITEGSMPPPAKQGEPATQALTNDETIALLMDIKQYPRKKEASSEEVLYLRLPVRHQPVPARKLQLRPRLPAGR